MAERVLAIIPARGGSKGIPRKNLEKVGGVSLVGHAVEQARRAERVTHVCVTSDDPLVLDVASSECPDFLVTRPPELAGDDAPLDPVIKHVLNQDAIGWGWGVVAVLQPTSPLRIPADIDACVEAIRLPLTMAMTVCNHAPFVWQRGVGGWWAPDYSPDDRPNRQQCIRVMENGAVYAFRPNAFSTFGARVAESEELAVVAMPWRRSVQVDTEEDLDLVRDLYEVQRRREGAA